MTKVDIFQLGFRAGANAREREGLPLEGSRYLPASVPEPPRAQAGPCDRGIWAQGFILGYRIGASDAELSRRRRGLVRVLSEEAMLKLRVELGD